MIPGAGVLGGDLARVSFDGLLVVDTGVILVIGDDRINLEGLRVDAVGCGEG